MAKYRIYMTVHVSQVVEVEADSAFEAAEIAEGQVDRPNISNKFDQDGDWRPISIENVDTDMEVWEAKGEDDYPAEEHESEW